jgi:hypothetical protein
MSNEMTPEEQKQLTREIAQYATEGIIKDIDNGKIPENWNGIELRLLLCDRISWHSNDKKILRAYRNTVIVNGL